MSANDHEGADVIVVGSGVSALSAAVTAAHEGASVLLLEKAERLGGTTRKAAAWMWVPGNRFMREQGIEDPKDDVLRMMARLAHPLLYDPAHPTYGLQAWEFGLLEAFLDNGPAAYEYMEEIGALELLHQPTIPNYYTQLEEDTVHFGRVMGPRAVPASAAIPAGPRTRAGGGHAPVLDAAPELGTGVDFVERMREAATRLDVDIRTSHRVTDLVLDDEGVVEGVLADTPDGERRFAAGRAVIFGSGGFTHGEAMARKHLGGRFVGGCAARTNEGDFHAMLERLGVPLVNMGAAFMAPMLLEHALAADPDTGAAFVVPGDSLLIVNKHGVRFGNEKATYNDRTMRHFEWDVFRHEYPNYLSFPVWDERAETFDLGAFGDYSFIPAAGADRSHVVEGATLEALATALDARLEELGPRIGHVRLGDGFAARLRASIERFNGFARAGVDEDFHRGETPIELAMTHGPVHPGNDLPSPLMYPLADRGPYYATILAPSSIDTKGGAITDAACRVIGHDGTAIGGLYGVGNCVASPSGQAYLAGGSTFGPFLTWGWVAARSALGIG
jgi:succinate dehydrogenase/fumarate reductase flavoprotein subunit